MQNHLALCIVWDIFRSLSIIVNSEIFRQIHVLFGNFSHIAAILKPCINLGYPDPCYIQNPGIFRTHDTFRTLSKHVLEYSECCVTLIYWKPCRIQNFTVFTILAYLRLKTYSESCLFGHIRAYLDIFNNDIYNNSNFLFFNLNLPYFSTKFKKAYIFWLQWRQFLCLSGSICDQ